MYSYKSSVPHSRARLEGENVSFKDLCAVCSNIRGMPVQSAINFLSLARDMRIPVYYSSWNKKLGSRHELGGKKGRYPWKAARLVLKLLKSAVANAEQKNMDIESLFLAHISANKKNEYPRYSSKGRRNISSLVTARIEVVLEESTAAVKSKPVKNPKPSGVQAVANKAGSSVQQGHQQENAQSPPLGVNHEEVEKSSTAAEEKK